VLCMRKTSYDAIGDHLSSSYRARLRAYRYGTGSDVDMTSRIERQIQRFAPGFRDLVLARHVMPPAALEQHNPI
jgi:phytoene dehydrogenase-like protein